MSDEDEKAMLPTTFCFPAVTEVSLGPRYSVRCHVRFFLIPRLFPGVLWASTGRNSPCAFSVFSLFFFLSLAPGTQKKKKIFFTSYTQIGRGFETALTSRRLTNHHIHVDAKGRGIKTIVGNWLERRSRVFYWDTWSACVSYFSM